jgi:hypothetical protein
MNQDDHSAVPTAALPTRVVLNDTTMAAVAAAVRAATNTANLLSAVVPHVYNALLAHGGRSLADLGEGERLRMCDYQIPTVQWQAITGAVVGRAEAWGTAAEVSLTLGLELMPDHYDDPQVTDPGWDMPDYRPLERRIVLTREAGDVIAGCENHLTRLREAYGATGPQYLAGLRTWHRNLAALMTMNNGQEITVSADGPLSLFVATSSGLVYGLVFHGEDRHCTVPGCRTWIAEDATTIPMRADTPVPDHEHLPSYPLHAPQPGTWTFHS